MMKMVPDIVILNYLINSKQLTKVMEIKLKAYIEIGYVTELNYQRSDGSFSCFGESDTSGSTWLTAFVVKYFSEAQKHVYIENRVIENALSWMVQSQSTDGNFSEKGRTVHSEMYDNSIALTSYCLIAILATEDAENEYNSTMQSAAKYIADNSMLTNRLYSLALASYALQLIKHPNATMVLNRFNGKAIEKDGLKWWEKPKLQYNNYYSSDSIDVETTAYGLLANLEVESDTSSLYIMQWLLKQRNSRGGYSSTQDTIVSIQALAKMAERISTDDLNMQVNIADDVEEIFNIDVNKQNSFLVQQNELNITARKVDFTASGSGTAIAQVSYKYYVDTPEPDPRFNIDFIWNPVSSKRYVNFAVCVNFIPMNVTVLGGGKEVVQQNGPSPNGPIDGSSPRSPPEGFTGNPDGNPRDASPDAVPVSVPSPDGKSPLLEDVLITKLVEQSNMAMVEVQFPSGFTLNLDILDALRSVQNVRVSYFY
jgi:CD109 antigen